MRFRILIAGASILLLATFCNKPTEEGSIFNEKKHLSPKKMIAVLVDVQLAESAIRDKQNQGLPYDYYTNYYYTSIFKKHGITKEYLNESLLYYKDDLKTLEIIYSRVVDSLSRLQGPAPKE